jgi:tetratricopeptide (TPR) repeat protein
MTFIKNTGVQWALGIILLVQGMALSQQSTENELGNSKADSLYQLVNSALARGEMDLVLETYPVLIEELKLIDDTARWIEALRGLGEIQFFRGMYEPALENIITEARLLSIQGNLNLLAIKLNRRGSLYHRLGRVDSAKFTWMRDWPWPVKCRIRPALFFHWAPAVFSSVTSATMMPQHRIILKPSI